MSKPPFTQTAESNNHSEPGKKSDTENNAQENPLDQEKESDPENNWDESDKNSDQVKRQS